LILKGPKSGEFTINSFLENENFESFSFFGNFQIIDKETFLDMKLKFVKFDLGILSSLGGDVISNIRGLVSEIQQFKVI
jgi:hypothetical protein